MNRFFNKAVRKAMSLFDKNELSQEQNFGVGEGEVQQDFASLLRLAGAEGCVLLKNKGVLPFSEDETISVFGRVQRDWFYVGNGSGGDVRAPYKVSLIDGLNNCGKIKYNKVLAQRYKAWCEKPKNEADPGFWGHWPRFYPEMPLSDEVVSEASANSDSALVVIGRSAGEDRENSLSKGSFYLTKKENEMLDSVTKKFSKVALVLNIGSVMDFSEIEKYGDKIGAILICWQGGMESGNSLADVLCGKVNPCGKLTDTIAKTYSDYPSAQNFGDKTENYYTEDIYVGYRYFDTFAKSKILYPFGFGLSYTDFEIKPDKISNENGNFSIEIKVKNVGKYAGKQVLQLYVSAPNGELGKPEKVLVSFAKTKLLEPNESETIVLSCDEYSYSSFDDSGVTGSKDSYVLESGEYKFFVGASSLELDEVYSYEINSLKVLQTLTQAMPVDKNNPYKRFKRVQNGKRNMLELVDVPLSHRDLKERILKNMPEGTPQTDFKGYKLKDVKSGKVSMDDFVAQLSLEELEAISRGEGPMNSAQGAKGNAGAMGGVIESLREKGIPAVITTDGPSGLRLHAACSLLPCGTALACTWDTNLICEVFTHMGKEMKARGSDILLAPGMNIHRNPLCGRNFEYFSEDPCVSGKIAAAIVKGVQSTVGLSACPKHFCCNNQEYNRNKNNSIVSERALREIYLKGFEICIKTAKPYNIMTSYNKVNGVWSHYNYDLCTTILRDEWGYKGNVMTDWWMQYAPSPEFPQIESNAYRVRAQVDVLMPGAKAKIGSASGNDGSLLASYGSLNGITLGEMQRSAKNLLNYIIECGIEL